MSRRDLAHFLDSTGVLAAILRSRGRMSAPRLTVLTYHRVHKDPGARPFDSDLIDATPEEFERQVSTLKRHFNVIGLEELRAFLLGRPLPDNPAMITFDDGYRDCHDRVLPILLSCGVKGVFFIATSYVTHRRVFWWDRISYLLNRAVNDRIELRYPSNIVLERKLLADRGKRIVLELMKNKPGIDVERFLGELADASGVSWNDDLERQFADELVMTWDQITKLRAAGMEVHSHTRTHRVLQMVPLGELGAELAGARTDLEEHLGERVLGIAYPVGRSISGSAALRAAVNESGYELGFTSQSGVSSFSRDFDPLNVRRISVERGMPHSYFRALLAIPAFAEIAQGSQPEGRTV